MKRYILFLFAAILTIQVSYGANSQLIAAADSAYVADDFRQAIAGYEQALKTEGSSTMLFYNLGNALYRDGQIGRAVIAYERALKIDPSNSDARFNLEFVKRRLVDKPKLNSTTMEYLRDKVVSWFSPDSWAWISCGLFLLFLGLVAVYLFTTPVVLRKIGFFGGFISLILAVLSFITAEYSASRTVAHDEGVVVSSSVIMGSAPRTPKDRNEEIALIHEGTKIQVIDSLTNRSDSLQSKWYKVQLDRNHQGWLPAPNIEII